MIVVAKIAQSKVVHQYGRPEMVWRHVKTIYNIRQFPKNKFKKTLRKLLFDILNSEDNYIDTTTLIKKVNLAKNVEE